MTGATPPRCVVFDLDDTLFDELDFVRSGYAAVAAVVRERYDHDSAQLLDERLAAGRLAGAFQEVVQRAGLPEAALSLMVETYRGHRPTIRPRPGARAALECIKRRDGVVGCITDGRSSTQRNKVAALGLEDLLSPLLISEETGHGKPDPHNFLELMRLVPAREYWYVADNPAKDFIAPNGLGWTTVGVDSPRGVHPGAAAPSPAHRPRHQLAFAEALTLLCPAGRA
jgi:putative hydrolase of the HAD superfamily